MPEFLSLISPEEALSLLFDKIHPITRVEMTPTEQALGKVTGGDILSPQDLPDFRRSTVDGYAVQARDTHGASESLPAYLMWVGEVPMGDRPGFKVASQQCAEIHTGGMLPEGADAVVMIEDTQNLASAEIEIFRPAATGENIIEIGEDVSVGEIVIPRGTRLRPGEIGGLMALGITVIETVIPPKFGIISSGDEVIPPDQQPRPGQVRDVNSYTLGALIHDLGGEVVHYGIIPDSRQVLKKIIQKALRECDHVVVTAGSSASARDLTAEIMNGLGDPGVLVHGISVKPGKPSIIALASDQVMIGLPGNPVSALVIANILIKPILEAYLGIEDKRPPPSIQAKLTVNISSQTGREDWIPVRLEENSPGNYSADPVFGRSNLIFILAKADGLVRIPPAVTGLEAGKTVSVRLL
ncbi:MAG: molybdopterin molybdenumtransferase MoeA [Chloroflexi bacterium]|nr:molybdopterin molybdenumtransferase MoeA [Chloroflexota bacterium]